MSEEQTKKHITILKNFLGNEVNSILEIQCGDGYDIENCVALQDKNLKYIGVDVVDEVIQDNRQYFRNEKNKLFMILDASNEPLPQCDLVVCSGMMEYLPIANIWSLIENIRDSGAKYVAFDYYHAPINGLKLNEDIKIENNSEICEEKNEEVDEEKGKKSKKSKKNLEICDCKSTEKYDCKKPVNRAINLTLAPFYFPQPKFLIPTGDINHSIALYKIKDIAFFMDWHNDDISYLRSKLFGYLESDFRDIKAVFDKEENGEQLFKDAITAGNINWNKMYYDEPYKTIVDKGGIFTKYIDFLILLYNDNLANGRIQNDQPERYKELLNEDNYLWASIIAKDFVKWKYNELF